MQINNKKSGRYGHFFCCGIGELIVISRPHRNLSLHQSNGIGVEVQFLIRAETTDAVLNVVGECLYVALRLWDAKDIDKDLVFALDDYIGGLSAFGH